MSIFRHLDSEEDAMVLLNGVVCTVSMPSCTTHWLSSWL